MQILGIHFRVPYSVNGCLSMTHSHESFSAAIESHVHSAPLQGGFRGGGSLVGRIVDAVRERLGNLGGILTDEIKAQIKASALAVFDRVNIPQLPDMIELPIKALLRPMLEHVLDAVLSAHPVIPPVSS